ncbi:hypothetical protein C437_15321 [Haloarcula vallismortis ATCC 29715]|uniref:Small CPxCG-related zinc finger protein n=1 Tax=Haloarcula vallismortis ATCC 29715 TaxID=662477 RepID=M0IY62_HALVA|nr:hypothetical protein [Haloarcula vallismortis]EMA01802.1 hypothetical protein C437_15321 [Haloarcula vallismortis ATCC 29715]
MPSCDACGAHVSRRYYRVRKGRDGDLHGCPSCADPATIERQAAGLDTRYRQRKTPDGEDIPRDAVATDGGQRDD